uniref:Galectin n=1 Tax=Oryzias latipes TaxID=8090 RepID=A0A3P9LE85_ORYLA
MTFVAPPGYQPVYNPRIPYLGPIHGGLREGMSIYIQGSIPKDISRFHVNLRCNESASGDIALHFNPRFDGLDKVVFNSYRNGSWESEEKVRSMPFTAGQAFETVIGVGAQGYEVRVNGKDFHTFKHRLPVQEVRGIQVEGDVSVQSITVIGVSLPTTHFCAVPFSTMIHGGMHPKKTFIIRGRVPSGADRMAVNFVASGSGNTALHLNPRVKAGEVVRNSRIGGDWGKEERQLSTNPFREGQFFDVRESAAEVSSGADAPSFSVNPPSRCQMSIRCGNQKFKVFVNGEHLFDFAHRMSFYEINMLEIRGDVQIFYVHF